MDTTTLAIVLSAQDKASGVLGAISDKLKGMGLVSQDASKQVENLGNKSVDSGNRLRTGVGIAAAVVAGSVALIGVKAVETAANFQQMTTTLVTTAGESVKNIAAVREGILQLSTQTGTSVEQMSKAMYTIESAGFHGANGLNILKAAAEGAKAENADLGKVADAVTSAMIDYHQPATKAADVTSKLVAAVGAGKSNFEDFTGALHSVLPIASAAHVSMNDILGDLASMTVHGMSADQASQNLANAIRTLQSPSQSAQQYLAQIGINAADLSDKLSTKGLSGTLQEVSQAIMKNMGPGGKVLIDAFNQSKSAASDLKVMLDKMPASVRTLANEYSSGKLSLKDYRMEMKDLPTDQANLLQQYVALNNRAHGFNNLLKSGSPEALTYSQALQKATGNATTMNVALMLTGENADYTNQAVRKVGEAHAEAGGHVQGWAYVQQNFNQKMAEAKNGLTNTGIAIGSALLPPLTTLMGLFVKIMTPIAEWVEKHQKLAAVLLASVGTVAALVAVVLTAKLAFDKVKDAVKAVEGAYKALDKFGMTSPWILALIVVAVIAYEVITHWKEVSKFFEKFWNDVKHWTDDAIKPLKTVWKDIKDAAKDVFDWVGDKIKDITKFFKDHKKGLEDIAVVLSVILGPAFVALAIKVAIATVQMIASAVATGAAWVASAASASYAWVTQELPKIITGMATSAGKAAIQAAKAGGAWVAQAVRTTAAWALTFLRFAAQMALMVGQFLLQAGRMALGWMLAMGPIGLIVAVVAGVIAMIVLHWKGFSKFFSQLWDDVVNFVKSNWKIILDIILGPLGLIITNWGAITRFFGKLWEDIKNIFHSVAGFVVNNFISDLNFVLAIWNGVTGFFRSVVGGIGSVFSGIVGIITSPFRSAFNGIASLWNNTVGRLSFNVPSWVPGIGGKGFSLPKIPMFAQGVQNFSGGLAIVGERGPELVQLPQGSNVIPNNQSAQALNSSTGGETHFHINVNMGVYAGRPGEIDQIGQAIYQSLQRIARRHGLADNLPNIGILPQ